MPDDRLYIDFGNTTRTPVEQLKVGDVVQAVQHGPFGTVINADNYGWTIVEYHSHPGGKMTYKHGVDGLYVRKSR